MRFDILVLLLYIARGGVKNAPNVKERTRKMFEFEDSKGKIFEIEEYDLFQAWNEYCEDGNDPDSEIYSNDEEFLEYFSKEDIAKRVAWGDFNFYDEYVTFDGYGNFKTSNRILDLINEGNIDDDFLHDYCAEYAKVEQVRY